MYLSSNATLGVNALLQGWQSLPSSPNLFHFTLLEPLARPHFLRYWFRRLPFLGILEVTQLPVRIHYLLMLYLSSTSPSWWTAWRWWEPEGSKRGQTSQCSSCREINGSGVLAWDCHWWPTALSKTTVIFWRLASWCYQGSLECVLGWTSFIWYERWVLSYSVAFMCWHGWWSVQTSSCRCWRIRRC